MKMYSQMSRLYDSGYVDWRNGQLKLEGLSVWTSIAANTVSSTKLHFPIALRSHRSRMWIKTLFTIICLLSFSSSILLTNQVTLRCLGSRCKKPTFRALFNVNSLSLVDSLLWDGPTAWQRIQHYRSPNSLETVPAYYSNLSVANHLKSCESWITRGGQLCQYCSVWNCCTSRIAWSWCQLS